MSSPSPIPPVCTTLPVITSCNSGQSCLEIKNLVNEDVSIIQVTVPPYSPTAPCGVVAQKQTVMFQVQLNASYFVVGNQTKTVYNSGIPITSSGLVSIPITNPPSPAPPALLCESNNWESGENFVLVGIVIVVLGILAFFLVKKIQKTTNSLQSQSPQVPKLSGLDAQLADVNAQISGLTHSSASQAISTGRSIGYIGMGGIFILILIWMVAVGPLSKKETCNKCLARGPLWTYTKDDSLLCKMFGRCSCRSAFMENQCSLLSAENTPPNSPAAFVWNTAAASQRSQNQSDYLCQCCPTSSFQGQDQSCYNVSQYPYVACENSVSPGSSPSPSSPS